MSFRTLAARTALVLGVALGASALADSSIVTCDPALPSFAKSGDPIAGNLNSVGSDTMNNLMTLWGESFSSLYPKPDGKGSTVAIQVEGKGSNTAPIALTEGTAQFGPMSRDMKADEAEAFEKKYGYKPTRLRVALDALAVFVHRDNPLQGLSLTQIDAIFSSTRKRGGNDVTTWGDLGLTGEWADKPINLYGRNSASGTNSFFKEHALKKGDYRNTVKEQPGSASVVQGVSEDKYAIGYSGIGYMTSGVRPLAIAEKDGGKLVVPGQDTVRDETYPLWRYLNLYVNKAPGKPMSPIVRDFCRFVFSREGQEIVVKDKYLPIDESFAARERKLIE